MLWSIGVQHRPAQLAVNVITMSDVELGKVNLEAHPNGPKVTQVARQYHFQ
jgi:hypothetical protein